MLRQIFLLVIIVVFFTITLKGQDTLFFMNGKIVPCKILTEISDSIVPYKIKYKTKKGLFKNKKARSYRVFSIVDSSNYEVIIYRQDTLEDNELSLNEARIYMIGAQDGRYKYQPTYFIYNTVPAGLSAVFAWYGLWVPTALTAFSEFFPPEVSVKKGANEKYIYNEAYKLGFEKAARRKRIVSNFVSGEISFFATFAIFYFLK